MADNIDLRRALFVDGDKMAERIEYRREIQCRNPLKHAEIQKPDDYSSPGFYVVSNCAAITYINVVPDGI